jgi:hypothetical protein
MEAWRRLIGMRSADCRAASGSLPTRQGVTGDGPHHLVELVTTAATPEPRRPCPERGHIGATLHLRIRDNSRHWWSTNALAQQLPSPRIAGHPTTPGLSRTEKATLNLTGDSPAAQPFWPIAAVSCRLHSPG